MRLKWSERLFLWAHKMPRTRASRFVFMLYEIRSAVYRWRHKIDQPDNNAF